MKHIHLPCIIFFSSHSFLFPLFWAVIVDSFTNSLISHIRCNRKVSNLEHIPYEHENVFVFPKVRKVAKIMNYFLVIFWPITLHIVCVTKVLNHLSIHPSDRIWYDVSAIQESAVFHWDIVIIPFIPGREVQFLELRKIRAVLPLLMNIFVSFTIKTWNLFLVKRCRWREIYVYYEYKWSEEKESEWNRASGGLSGERE